MGIFICIVIIVIALAIYGQVLKARRIQQLKANYEYALGGSDRRAALNAGRAYYSALRDNKTLTIYDEQAITNDLSAMI